MDYLITNDEIRIPPGSDTYHHKDELSAIGFTPKYSATEKNRLGRKKFLYWKIDLTLNVVEDIVTFINTNRQNGLTGEILRFPEHPDVMRLISTRTAEVVPESNPFILPLWDHQKENTLAIRKIEHFAELDEMGCGKTRTVIEAALERDKWPVLVCCPASIKYRTWHKQLTEIKEQTGLPLKPHVLAKSAKDNIADLKDYFSPALDINKKYHFIITNPEMIRLMKDGMKRFHWGGIVVDESTMIANDSKQTRALISLAQNADWRAIMTGTVFAKDLESVFYQFRFLDHRIFGKQKNAFLNRYFSNNLPLVPRIEERKLVLDFPYCEAAVTMIKNTSRYFYHGESKTWRSKFPVDNLESLYMNDIMLIERLRQLKVIGNWYPRPGSEELIKKRMAMVSVQQKKRDVFKDLPELLPDVIRDVPMGTDQRRIYNELRDKLITEIDGEIISIDHAFTKTMKLMQVAGGFAYDEFGDPLRFPSAKLGELGRVLDEAGDNQHIIYAHFTESVEAIVRMIEERGETYAPYYGKMSTLR